jgi:hypothetical protein
VSVEDINKSRTMNINTLIQSEIEEIDMKGKMGTHSWISFEVKVLDSSKRNAGWSVSSMLPSEVASEVGARRSFLKVI